MAINAAHLFSGDGIYSLPFLTLCLFVIILVRYLVVAGLTWWLVCSKFSLLDQDVFKDIRSSVVSAAIFAMAMAAAIEFHMLGWTQIYNQNGNQDWWYIGGSYVLVLILQDSYFYITPSPFSFPALVQLGPSGTPQISEAFALDLLRF
jgi:hypothetical protein